VRTRRPTYSCILVCVFETGGFGSGKALIDVVEAKPFHVKGEQVR
jgi:hypothetical protein